MFPTFQRVEHVKHRRRSSRGCVLDGAQDVAPDKGAVHGDEVDDVVGGLALKDVHGMLYVERAGDSSSPLTEESCGSFMYDDRA